MASGNPDYGVSRLGAIVAQLASRLEKKSSWQKSWRQITTASLSPFLYPAFRRETRDDGNKSKALAR